MVSFLPRRLLLASLPIPKCGCGPKRMGFDKIFVSHLYVVVAHLFFHDTDFF